MQIEVGQTYSKKSGRKMNVITNARSQWYGRAIEFKVTDINNDEITYDTIHPTRGPVTRMSTSKRFLKLINKTNEMNYSKTPLYRTLSKKEKIFLNEHMARLKKDFRSREQDDEFIKDSASMVHNAALTELYLGSDEAGSIDSPEHGDGQPSKKAKPTVPKVNKDTYSRGAFRRWKRNGLISEDGKTATINQIKYEIVQEGKKYKLIAPGQSELPLTKQSNEKISKPGKPTKAKVSV